MICFDLPIGIHNRENIIISLECLAVFNQVIDNVSDRGRRNPFTRVNTSVDPQCRGIWFSIAYSYNLFFSLSLFLYRSIKIHPLPPLFFYRTYLERPSFHGMANRDDGTNVGESISQVIEVSVDVLESVVTGPFHSMTWRVYLQDYPEVARPVSLDDTWKIFRSVDSETWIDFVRSIFFAR